MAFYKVNFFQFAFRNIGRHKMKTFLTLLAIFIGISLYIFMDGWLLGIEIDSMRNLVNFETGSAKIYTKEYFENKDELPMYENFGGYAPLLAALFDNGYAASPRSVFTGIMIGREKEYPFAFYGIDPDLENTVFRNYRYMESGEFVKKGQFAAVIGINGAKKLNVSVGDEVRLYTTIDKKDEIGKLTHTNQVIDLKIGGIIESPNPKINGNIGFLPLDILQGETGLMIENTVTEIAIRKLNAKDYELPGTDEDPRNILGVLDGILPGNLILVGWEEDARDYLAISQTKRGGSGVILMLLMFITVLLISNTMMLAVIERTKELGMMRSMGMGDLQIIILLLMEGGILGIIGSFLGVAGGITADFFMINYGIDLTEMLRTMGTEDIGYRVIGISKSAWNVDTIIGSFFFGVIVSILAAFFPAIRAVRLQIIESLQFE